MFPDINILGVSKVLSGDNPDPSPVIRNSPSRGRSYSGCMVEVTSSSVGMLLTFSSETQGLVQNSYSQSFVKIVVYHPKTSYKSPVASGVS